MKVHRSFRSLNLVAAPFFVLLLAVSAGFARPASARTCQQFAADYIRGLNLSDQFATVQALDHLAPEHAGGQPQGHQEIQNPSKSTMTYGLDGMGTNKKPGWFFEFSRPPMVQTKIHFDVVNGHCVATGFELQGRPLRKQPRCDHYDAIRDAEELKIARLPRSNRPQGWKPRPYDAETEACRLIASYRSPGPDLVVVPKDSVSVPHSDSRDAR